MSDFITTVLLVTIVSFLFFIFGLSVGMSSDESYKKGQIDAINGIIRYELVLQPNNEKIWMKKPDTE